MQTRSVSIQSNPISRSSCSSPSESSSSPRSPHPRLVKQARCTDLTRLCPTLPRSVPVSTPTVSAATARPQYRKPAQRKNELISPRKSGQPGKPVLRQEGNGSESPGTVRAKVAFAPMSKRDADCDGAPKELGVQRPTKRSVADRGELISRDLPFQAPIVVAVEVLPFGPDSTITVPEYADHALNVRLLNYLPRDEELLALSRVAVEALKAIGSADVIFNASTSTTHQRASALVTTYTELKKLEHAMGVYLDAKTGKLDVGAEEGEADRFDAVAEKLEAIEDNIQAAWASIKKNEGAIRAAGFNL